MARLHCKICSWSGAIPHDDGDCPSCGSALPGDAPEVLGIDKGMPIEEIETKKTSRLCIRGLNTGKAMDSGSEWAVMEEKKPLSKRPSFKSVPEKATPVSDVGSDEVKDLTSKLGVESGSKDVVLGWLVIAIVFVTMWLVMYLVVNK